MQAYIIDTINRMFSFKKIHVDASQIHIPLTGKGIGLTACDLYTFYRHIIHELDLSGELLGGESYCTIASLVDRCSELRRYKIDEERGDENV